MRGELFLRRVSIGLTLLWLSGCAMLTGVDEPASKKSAFTDTFLEANSQKPGVVVLPSGLQYKVLKSGEGYPARLTDTVVVHYRGTLTNGTEFDSSLARGEPARFAVNRVIQGWTEALQMMRKGDKWELYIPSTLAYGQRTVGSLIGPGATLVFEVELLDIVSGTGR